MNPEFKKLFSGLIEDAGQKADEGKLLVKNAIHKITKNPADLKPEEKSRTAKPLKGTKKQPSAFQQNLRKLQQYDEARSTQEESTSQTTWLLPDDDGEVVISSTATTLQTRDTASDHTEAPFLESSLNPNPPSSAVTATETEKKEESNHFSKREKKTESVSPQQSAFMGAIADEKQTLLNKIQEWQENLAENGYSSSLPSNTNESVDAHEALVERLQAILDQISGQITQVQTKKNELEAQKLLFDSTCSTLYQEREDYRRAIETFAHEIAQKHEELSNYLIQWENDAQLWTHRKTEIETLRAQALKEQQQYQQSIADYVQQIDARQKTLAELEAKLSKQEVQWEHLVTAMAENQAKTEQDQAVYREQILNYIQQLETRQGELDEYMTGWNDRLNQWLGKMERLESQERDREKLFLQTEQLFMAEQEKSQKLHQQIEKELSHQTQRLEQKKTEVTSVAEEAVKLIELLHQEMTAKQTEWVQSVEVQLETQQKKFSEEQGRLNAMASQQIDLLTEQLAAANELYLSLYKEHQHQLAETLAMQPDIVTESIWRNRLSFAVAFLPQLPVYASADDISMLFGGIEIQFKSPYIPPSEASIPIKYQLYERLPENEKQLIQSLCQEIANHYRIELHPVMQNVAQ